MQKKRLDLKSILIGAAASALLFLLMGATDVRFASSAGRYQLSAAENTVAILDTQTGLATVLMEGKLRSMHFGQFKD